MSTPVAAYYAFHEELCRQKKDPVSLPIQNRKSDLYNKYVMYYKNSCVDYIKIMIINAISQGETSCIIYDEDTGSSNLSADELVNVFKIGVGEKDTVSIESIIREKYDTEHFRLTLYRTSNCKIIRDTTVIVQFVLHWDNPQTI